VPDLSTLLILGSINALLAWSMWVPLASGQVSFGTAGAAATGGYSLAWLNLHTSVGLGERLAAGTVAGALAMLLAGLIGLRVKGFALGVVTLAISEIIALSIGLIPSLGGPAGLAGLELTNDATPIAVCALVALVIISWAVYRGPLGRDLDAVASSELHAASIGIRAKVIHLGAFVASGAAAGLAGGLTVAYSGFVDPSIFQLSLNVTAFSAVIVGGVTVFYGPIFGAFALTALLNSSLVSGSDQDLISGAVLVLAVLVRREGVLRRSARLQRHRVQRLARSEIAQPDTSLSLHTSPR
jgi:branched-chain amino acid transport system permease protein